MAALARSCEAALDGFLAEAAGQDWIRLVPGFADLARIACRQVDGLGVTLAPEPGRVFAAFRQTPPARLRAVILGQDPYPTPGHANGLAFSHIGPPPLPRSLVNIYRELEADQGFRPVSGDLSGWAREGVLLMNTALTVTAGTGGAGSHLRLGWQALTDSIVATLAAGQQPLAFVLWGRPAQAKRPLIDEGRHLVIASAHPSPLSARRGFFGSRPFGRINGWLEAQGERLVDWSTGLRPGVPPR